MTSILYGYSEMVVCQKRHAIVRVFIWVPLYHDYGLLNRLMVLYAGQELYTLEPISFIQNPLLWPEAMKKYKCNITIGPNFSYALVARKLKETKKSYQLPDLECVNVSAEPIAKRTIEDMKGVWGIPESSITHSYGLAEAWVWISTVKSEFDEETGIAACASLSLTGFIEDAKSQFGVRFKFFKHKMFLVMTWKVLQIKSHVEADTSL
jgi:acyl-CoA synthetase (AMP-forming)/AMP-acid ligase II